MKETIFEVLLNGNLSDAQEMAKDETIKSLVNLGMETMEYDYNQALITACYLKKQITFEDYCDAFNNKK